MLCSCSAWHTLKRHTIRIMDRVHRHTQLTTDGSHHPRSLACSFTGSSRCEVCEMCSLATCHARVYVFQVRRPITLSYVDTRPGRHPSLALSPEVLVVKYVQCVVLLPAMYAYMFSSTKTNHTVLCRHASRT